ncbi:MAG: 1-(5-phosphoribosyl)-5-[(5-phosphoribosylamino)methylideneamino]imidazole-4-carboxamide isomerase [Eubacteriales bacterium]
MIIFPAIDLKNGKCVRLEQGDFSKENIFSDNPLEIAIKWQEQGAEYLHLVDLDGALTGVSCNLESIVKIVSALKIPVQVGGGIRTRKQVEELLAAGVGRVIIGTKALSDKDFIKELINDFGEKVIVSIDAKDGFVAIKGWTEISTIKAVDLAIELKGYGLKTLVYTDIAKDGMMIGPNFHELKNINNLTGLQIIASGGVSTPSDVDMLRQMNVYGAIIGKALYMGTIELQKVL